MVAWLRPNRSAFSSRALPSGIVVVLPNRSVPGNQHGFPIRAGVRDDQAVKGIRSPTHVQRLVRNGCEWELAEHNAKSRIDSREERPGGDSDFLPLIQVFEFQ